jgi:hypothetical protein
MINVKGNMTKAKIEYGISWDVFNTGKWRVFEMPRNATLLTFDTRNEANAALEELNKQPIKSRQSMVG